MTTPGSASRPTLERAWAAFMQINVPVAEVGKKIGGYVEKNMNLPEGQGRFENACPIRMSYVLNYSGCPIAKSALYGMVSGADGKQYIFRVADMAKYLANTFGKPDKVVTGLPKKADFVGTRGLIVVQGHGWSDASGHVTLWNGTECPDDCHFADEDNGAFTPNQVSLWSLQ
ncbi:MAG: type VI secretion system amidase effector protein Tae4 [Burkholderiaceae bacterium]|nr:type VI secretion system amidase effector protein Tae4 [Burkholderiaceae bacterium]